MEPSVFPVLIVSTLKVSNHLQIVVVIATVNKSTEIRHYLSNCGEIRADSSVRAERRCDAADRGPSCGRDVAIGPGRLGAHERGRRESQSTELDGYECQFHSVGPLNQHGSLAQRSTAGQSRIARR